MIFHLIFKIITLNLAQISIGLSGLQTANGTFPMKKLTLALLPLTLLAMTTHVNAATSDGKTFGVSAGWLHVMPQSDAQGVNGKTSAPLPVVSSNSQQAGFEVQDSDTAGLMFDYFVNDNVSIELVLGTPPEMELSGTNSIKVMGQDVVGLDKYSKAATTDAYTPTITGRYHFGSIDNKFRPYVGAGLMYAHFSNVEADATINSELKATVNGMANAIYPQFGGKLDLQPSLGKVKVDDAIAPVITIGADYSINKDWFATASVSYAHLSTDAKISVNGIDPMTQSATTLLTGSSKIEINPIVTYLGLGYRF